MYLFILWNIKEEYHGSSFQYNELNEDTITEFTMKV